MDCASFPEKPRYIILIKSQYWSWNRQRGRFFLSPDIQRLPKYLIEGFTHVISYSNTLHCYHRLPRFEKKYLGVPQGRKNASQPPGDPPAMGSKHQETRKAHLRDEFAHAGDHLRRPYSQRRHVLHVVGLEVRRQLPVVQTSLLGKSAKAQDADCNRADVDSQGFTTNHRV